MVDHPARLVETSRWLQIFSLPKDRPEHNWSVQYSIAQNLKVLPHEIAAGHTWCLKINLSKYSNLTEFYIFRCISYHFFVFLLKQDHRQIHANKVVPDFPDYACMWQPLGFKFACDWRHQGRE